VFPTYQYASRTDSPLLDVAGVRYLVTGRRPSTFLENLYNEDPLEPPPPLLDDDPDRPLTLALDDALVYENRRSLSRAWFVTEVTPARDEDEAERLLGQARSSRELGARPVVEGAACSGVAGPPVPVRVEDPHNDEVRVAVHAPAAGWLILADTWYPGWEARDAAGTVLAIHPANLAFRAVPLPAGDHRIEFRYRPGSFRLGLLLGAASLAAILLLLWRDR
jgi:hypothetical protein